MNEVVKTEWARAVNNGDFISVETCSGYRSMVSDPQGIEHLLAPDVADQNLGSAVLDALSHSRFVSPLDQPKEDMELFDYKLVSERYAEWTKKLMVIYGYKTKRSLFKNMASCAIERRNGFITIRPSCHENLEGWSGEGISKKDYVVISDDCQPAEVGAALRLAFSRCT